MYYLCFCCTTLLHLHKQSFIISFYIVFIFNVSYCIVHLPVVFYLLCICHIFSTNEMCLTVCYCNSIFMFMTTCYARDGVNQLYHGLWHTQCLVPALLGNLTANIFGIGTFVVLLSCLIITVLPSLSSLSHFTL